jgi:hypothetical protein
MASADAVSQLSCKAVTLLVKGHLARAAEKYRAALAAATEPPAAPPPDCLIVAALQLRVISASLQHIEQPDVPLAAKAHIIWEALTELLPAAVATVRRRRDAGTLLGGKCSAAEEAWQRDQAGAIMRANGKSDAQAARYCSLVGYCTFLSAADAGLELAESAAYFGTLRAAGHAARLEAHRVLTCALVEEATALMAAPRRHNGEFLASETQLVSGLLAYSATGRKGTYVLPEPHCTRVADALRRLHASGVLADRNIAAGLAAGGVEVTELTRARESASASRRLRSCGLAACGARESHPAHFKLCSACTAVAYCCKAHQMEGWPEHKTACNAARSKAAAEDAAAPSGSAA